MKQNTPEPIYIPNTYQESNYNFWVAYSNYPERQTNKRIAKKLEEYLETCRIKILKYFNPKMTWTKNKAQREIVT